MMRRTFAYIIAISAFSILASSWLISRSAAEPISGGSLGTPAEAAPSAAATPGQPKQSAELTEAETQFRKGNFPGALKALQEAVKKDPDQPPAQVLMAQLLSQAKMLSEVRVPWSRR